MKLGIRGFYLPIQSYMCKKGSYMHVVCLGISNKFVAVPRQDSIRPYRAHAVLSGHYVHRSQSSSIYNRLHFTIISKLFTHVVCTTMCPIIILSQCLQLIWYIQIHLLFNEFHRVQAKQ